MIVSRMKLWVMNFTMLVTMMSLAILHGYHNADRYSYYV